MVRPRILLLEEERSLAEILKYHLEREGFEVTIFHDGCEGFRKIKLRLPDLIILDRLLPGMDGLEICRKLRSNDLTFHIPIIMLSTYEDETDEILGFMMGADDYVQKPFSCKVFVHRVKAIQRRLENSKKLMDIVEHRGVKVDRFRHIASYQGKELELTSSEFRLLEVMLRQPGRAFTRTQLLDLAIGQTFVLQRTIDVHIKTLRKKIGASDLIETVRGVGYRFQENPDGKNDSMRNGSTSEEFEGAPS